MSRNSRLIKNTAIIGISNICTKCISFLLLPLYTALLSSSEYGTVDLINTFVNLFAGLFSLQFEYGLFRFLIEVREKEQSESSSYISTAIVGVAFSSIVFVVISCTVLPWINAPYKYFIISNTLITIVTAMCLQIARGINKNECYAIGSFICASLQVLLNVFFIAGLKWNVLGMLLSSVIAHSIAVIYLFIRCKLYKYFRFDYYDKEKLSKLIKYSLPLIPNNLCWWIVNVSDRIVISSLIDTAANGIYTVACKFPTLFETVANIFILSWNESAAENIDADDRDRFYTLIMKQSVGFFASTNYVILALLPLVYFKFINISYEASYYQVPILMMGALFHTISSLYGSIYSAFKKTKGIARTTFIAAIINLLINVLFVKRIGIFAASFSTLIAYFSITCIRHKEINKYISISYGYGFLLSNAILSVLSIVIYYMNNSYLSLAYSIIAISYYFVANKKMIAKIYSLIIRKTRG